MLFRTSTLPDLVTQRVTRCDASADAPVEQVAGVYSLAHKLGCKGVTIFRYGSKFEQVLHLGAEEEPYEREYFTRCDPGACKL
jgi:ribonucleotide reductase alpha subunit